MTTERISYHGRLKLSSELTLGTVATIEAYLSGIGRCSRAGDVVEFNFDAASEWDACSTAHEIAQQLASEGIEWDPSSAGLFRTVVERAS